MKLLNGDIPFTYTSNSKENDYVVFSFIINYICAIYNDLLLALRNNMLLCRKDCNSDCSSSYSNDSQHTYCCTYYIQSIFYGLFQEDKINDQKVLP